MGRKLEVIWHTYWRLTIISEVEPIKNRRRFLCECKCWNQKEINLRDMRHSWTVSCGCYWQERRTDSATKHWLRNSRSRNSWRAMKSRCNNKDSWNYKYYWWRWISYDPNRESFDWFYSDMWDRPENKTLDRIDNDLDYCKDNCRRADKYEQANNKRK